MSVATRDPFGFNKWVYHRRSGLYSDSIHALLRDHSLSPGEIDHAAIVGFLSGKRLPGRTVLQNVWALPPGHALLCSSRGPVLKRKPHQLRRGDLDLLLRCSLQTALDSGKRVALALSGGLDSALLLAMLKTMGTQQIPVYILAVDLPNYGELDAAMDTARQLGVEAIVIEASEDDFVAALPETIRQVEEPLFNLHPVAKLLLARAMHSDGIELAISGDGADQVLNRDHSADYLPLCNALFHSTGVELHTPFLDTAVVAHLFSLPPDPAKQCLRELAGKLQLGNRLVRGPKHSRLAPPMALGLLLDRSRISAMADLLQVQASALNTDVERVLWVTLLLALDHLGVTT